MNREVRDVTFDSHGTSISAWLYLPSGRPADARPPILVMAHGLGSVKRLRLDAYAEVFSAAGYACLVFDYRHFGDSGGEPRELIDITEQRQDWVAAVAYARSLDAVVDPGRVVLWGTSFGGGHAIVTAADDPDVRAVVVQGPFTDGRASARAAGARNVARLSAYAVLDLAAAALRRPPVRVKGAGRTGEVALMASSADEADVLRLLDSAGLSIDTYRNLVPARVAPAILLDVPGRRVAEVGCPIMFCICDDDSVAPAAATRRHAARARVAEIRNYPAGHFQIYTGPLFDEISADQLAFLRRHVPAEVPVSTAREKPRVSLRRRPG